MNRYCFVLVFEYSQQDDLTVSGPTSGQGVGDMQISGRNHYPGLVQLISDTNVLIKIMNSTRSQQSSKQRWQEGNRWIGHNLRKGLNRHKIILRRMRWKPHRGRDGKNGQGLKGPSRDGTGETNEVSGGKLVFH
ncbi:hypothetical protein PoB_005646000 [Plakobranchus ocellatus]|uniref:Uncharacterized protein n=1 Tax=Plakobranchus ocellatus TaxID=259542 RepID=A0AAV4CES4_9GAST|nr:hypothetical protein PoB_005646000 [Plakobranchus ocellatus]